MCDTSSRYEGAKTSVKLPRPVRQIGQYATPSVAAVVPPSDFFSTVLFASSGNNARDESEKTGSPEFARPREAIARGWGLFPGRVALPAISFRLASRRVALAK